MDHVKQGPRVVFYPNQVGLGNFICGETRSMSPHSSISLGLLTRLMVGVTCTMQSDQVAHKLQATSQAKFFRECPSQSLFFHLLTCGRCTGAGGLAGAGGAGGGVPGQGNGKGLIKFK